MSQLLSWLCEKQVDELWLRCERTIMLLSICIGKPGQLRLGAVHAITQTVDAILMTYVFDSMS